MVRKAEESPTDRSIFDQLLHTKFRPPRRFQGAVDREHLMERLEHGRQRRLTAVVAPAGYGKTTLLVEWASTCAQPVAWFSIEAADNEPKRFWRHLIGAIQERFPAVGREVLPSLRAPEFSDPVPILTALLNEIAALDDPFCLVLEDLHFVDEPGIHRGLVFLLEHLPDDIHLLLSSRVSPPLGLARLRVQEELEEITASDLSFSSAEAHRFFVQTMELNLTDEQVTSLHRRSEGWVAGLQLAGLSARHGDGNDREVERFGGNNRFVVDYLSDEVLGRLPPDIQRFLLETSVLEKLSAPLCEAVTREKGAQLKLEGLERGNLF
ncbi:MAG: AAA family ATPase, partial [Myxococcota bacterium]